jgi:hypothetical protein
MIKYCIVVFSLLSFSAFAQKSEFPINEIGKYELSEVVEMGGMDKNKLFQNGQKFMKKVKVLNSRKKFYTEDEEAYSIQNRGSFYVYRLGSMKKGIAGAVEYDLSIKVKDEKYRYTLTNFIFNEYKRNRYAKYEPIIGKYTPLEVEVSALNKKEWDQQRQQVYDKSQELIQNLYSDMIYVEQKKKKKVKNSEDW